MDKIYKSVDYPEHVNSILKGKIILRSINFYRFYSNDLYKDHKEFSTSGLNINSGYADSNALIFCAHKNKPADRKHGVIISSPCVLFKEIRDSLKPSIKHSYFGQVHYNCPQRNNYPSINFFCDEVYNDNSSNFTGFRCIEHAFYKSCVYREQDEVRMCFFVKLEELAKNDNPNIKIFFKRESIYWKGENPPFFNEQIKVYPNFEVWQIDRQEKYYSMVPGGLKDFPVNKDDFWFEVHLTLPFEIYNKFKSFDDLK